MNFTRIAYTVSLLIVGLGLTVNGYSQSWLTNGLVAYYPFNGNANDASGNGHNGVVNGTTISPNMNQVGMTNGAFHFEGGSYISVTPTPFNVNSNWTISFWCILDANATGSCYVVSTAAYGLNIRHDGNETGLTNEWWFTFVSSLEGYLGAVPNNPNIWNMLTCVRNGSSCEMFFNNTLVASLTVVGTTVDTGALWFGRNQMAAGIGPHDLFGSLSDIRIYNRALSTNEVQQLFAYESVPHPCSPHAATAVATLDHGFVVAATITDGACGYINTPSVLIVGGGGTGATATAIVSNGVVVGINITDAGIGYTSTPTIYIASPPGVEVVLIKAVKPSFMDLSLGTNYQLQVSTNLNIWSNFGAPFIATNTNMVYPQYFDVDNWNSLYFRVQVSP